MDPFFCRHGVACVGVSESGAKVTFFVVVFFFNIHILVDLNLFDNVSHCGQLHTLQPLLLDERNSEDSLL